jgi:uncharacterized membrane protein
MNETSIRFRAVLTPKRWFSRRGLLGLVGVVALIDIVTGTVFFLAGAWPVPFFLLSSVIVLWLALRLNARSGQAMEVVELTSAELVLQRFFQGRPRAEHRFPRAWVKVELEEDEERELIGRLVLRSHGLLAEVGSFLSPEERKSFAFALKSALAQKHEIPQESGG